MVIEVYKSQGIDFKPMRTDIENYMKLVDVEGEGLISLSEFEALILQSLEARGLKF